MVDHDTDGMDGGRKPEPSRRDFLKASAWALAAPGFASFLAACSGAPPSASTATTGTATAAGGTAAPKTLTVAVEADASSLKPDTWGPTLNWYASRALYDNLLHYNTKVGPDGSLYFDDNNWEMRLAEKVDISPDRKTVTWTIRDGPTFASGKKIDAAAIAKSFHWYLDRDGVGGGQAKVDGLASRDAVKADGNTLILQLKDPAPWGTIANYISLLAVVDADEIMSHATPDDKFGEKWMERNATPSGPYTVEKWVSGEQMVLVARDDFYAGKPQIERIVFRVIPDASVRFGLVKRGEVDMVSLLDFKDLAALQSDANVAVDSWVSNNIRYLGLHWDEPEFQDKNVRKAIAYAVPYDEITTSVYYDFAVTAKDPFGQKVAGADPSAWPYVYDLDKAKEHLAQSGYANGFEKTLSVTNSDINQEKVAQLIAESLGKLGITITIQKMTDAQLSAAQIAKQLPMSFHDWTSFVPDAGYHALWNHLPDSYANFFAYNSPEATKVANEFMYLDPKDPRRTELLRQYQQILAEEVFGVYLLSVKFVMAHKKNLTGFAYYPDQPFGVRFDKLTLS